MQFVVEALEFVLRDRSGRRIGAGLQAPNGIALHAGI
jgi:hypothetical protein